MKSFQLSGFNVVNDGFFDYFQNIKVGIYIVNIAWDVRKQIYATNS